MIKTKMSVTARNCYAEIQEVTSLFKHYRHKKAISSKSSKLVKLARVFKIRQDNLNRRCGIRINDLSLKGSNSSRLEN